MPAVIVAASVPAAGCSLVPGDCALARHTGTNRRASIVLFILAIVSLIGRWNSFGNSWLDEGCSYATSLGSFRRSGRVRFAEASEIEQEFFKLPIVVFLGHLCLLFPMLENCAF